MSGSAPIEVEALIGLADDQPVSSRSFEGRALAAEDASDRHTLVDASDSVTTYVGGIDR